MGELTKRVVMRQLADALERCRNDKSRRALFNTAELLGLDPVEISKLNAHRRISRHGLNSSKTLGASPISGGDALPESEGGT
jgi:hypothetical protein